MSNALVPMGDLQKMAQAVASSKLFGIQNVDQALALMLVAQAEGLHPATVARDYHIIQGRPTLKSDAMLARYLNSGGKVEWHEHTDKSVAATFTHPAGGSLRVDWDFARAKQAGLGSKDMWLKYPRQMLRARVISEGIRSVFPGVVIGVYTPEEVADFEPAKSAPAAPELTEAEIRKAAMDAALEAHGEAVVRIKDCLSAGDLYGAAETWFSLDDDAKRALWVAPTKGGPFSTEERTQIKDPAFRAAYYGETK